MDARATFRLALTLDVRLSERNGKLRIDGPRRAVALLAPALQQHRSDLLAGPCTLCGVELATCGDRCRWCDVVRDRRLYHAPNSDAEQEIIAALARCDGDGTPVITLPGDERRQRQQHAPTRLIV